LKLRASTWSRWAAPPQRWRPSSSGSPNPSAGRDSTTSTPPTSHRLRAIGVSAGEKLPAARTNVAPTASRIEEPSLYAFTYTLPGDREGPAFVLSGAPETDRTSTEAKLLSILAVLDGRLDALGTTWEHCTATNFYGSALPAESAAVFQRLGSAAVHGVHWYPSLPPVTPLEYEIDARGTGREITI